MSRGTRMESDGLHPRRLWIKAWSEWGFLIVLDEMCWMTVKGGFVLVRLMIPFRSAANRRMQ